jgi:hypothetical protein
MECDLCAATRVSGSHARQRQGLSGRGALRPRQAGQWGAGDAARGKPCSGSGSSGHAPSSACEGLATSEGHSQRTHRAEMAASAVLLEPMAPSSRALSTPFAKGPSCARTSPARTASALASLVRSLSLAPSCTATCLGPPAVPNAMARPGCPARSPAARSPACLPAAPWAAM